MAFTVEIKVYPKSSEEKLVEVDGIYKVYVKSAPDKGKANAAVIKILAGKYNVRKSCIRIIKGKTNRNKVLEVRDI